MWTLFDVYSQVELLAQAEARQPDFKPYIFWAYGAACLLLFLFSLYTVAQNAKLRKRIDYLEARLDGRD